MREEIKELFTDDLLAYFSDEEQFNNLTHNIRGNIYLFELAHNIYDYVIKNKIELDNDIKKKIYTMEFIYNQILFKELRNSLVAPSSEVKTKLYDRLSKMRINDTFINDDVRISSVVDLYERECEVAEEYNGVTIITPTQTISRYNGDECDPSNSSGYHCDNFKSILEGVYVRYFDSNFSDQDILIRYVNYKYHSDAIRSMTLEIPYMINSSQKKVLIELQ